MHTNTHGNCYCPTTPPPPLQDRKAHFRTQWLAFPSRECGHWASGEHFLHTHTRISLSNHNQQVSLLSRQERRHNRGSAGVRHTSEGNKGSGMRVRGACVRQQGLKGSDVIHKQTRSHRQTQRFLTVSIAVVGVCDTPETLLSSSVPYLPEQEDISNIIIKYLMPPKFHPDVAAKC